MIFNDVFQFVHVYFVQKALLGFMMMRNSYSWLCYLSFVTQQYIKNDNDGQRQKQFFVQEDGRGRSKVCLTYETIV